MTVLGRVIKGQIQLPQPLNLPDGTVVEVDVPSSSDAEMLAASRRFWVGDSLAEIFARQNVKPVSKLQDLAGDWPADESVDGFVAQVRKGRW